ncbi:TPA_asm: maturation protein, partial [ssRNA phage Gerhypos.1_24]
LGGSLDDAAVRTSCQKEFTLSPHYRSRTRDDFRTGNTLVTVYNPGGVVQSSGLFSTSWLTSRSILNDWVGGSRSVKPTLHHTLLVTSQVPRPSPLTNGGGYYDVSSQYLAAPVGPSGMGDVGTLFGFPTAAQKSALGDQAFEALIPQIPQEVSLPNFLYELRELADLIPKIEDSLIKSAAGGYLTYSFGYAPLIGDLRKLANLAETVAARLQYLRDTWGRETRLSFESTWETTAPDTVVYNFGEVYTYRRLSFKGIFRAGGYLFHMLEDLDSKIGTLRGLVGALGFNNPLGVLWEAIPFSFVVDWFTRIGNAISRSAVQPFVGPWELRRVSHSYHMSGTWSYTVTFPNGYSPTKWEVAAGSYDAYQREVGLPVPASLIDTEGLTSNQQTLATALIASSLP